MAAPGSGKQRLGDKAILNPQRFAHCRLKILLHLTGRCHGKRLAPKPWPVNNGRSDASSLGGGGDALVPGYREANLFGPVGKMRRGRRIHLAATERLRHQPHRPNHLLPRLAFAAGVIEFGAASKPVRSLAKTEVMKSAALAALAGCVVCYPRLALWAERSLPIWYLEAVLLLGGFVLWAFVFAWHEQYTHRPVFALKLGVARCLLATGAGILAAFILHQFVDPACRTKTPEDYPANLGQWTAMTLFSLGFTQLFLIFAPYDWSVRLFKRRWLGILFTVLFGVFVLVVKTRSSPTPIAPWLFCVLIAVRAGIATISVWLYSRHGVILTWWWGFLLQTRHLLDLMGGS